MNKPLFNDTLNTLYFSARNIMPEPVQEQIDAHPGMFAAACGAVGAYVLTRAVQSVTKKVAPKFYDKNLPLIELMSAYVAFTAPIVVFISDPKGTMDILAQNPVHYSGVAGGLAGGIVAAVQDAAKPRSWYHNEKVNRSTFIDDLSKISRCASHKNTGIDLESSMKESSNNNYKTYLK